ncbi:mechanosensitive ion channel family protein [Entomospira entomophila]|uniref:Mechanosensitive ion channel family protein n=1 Tax=Entomospira entomophila TaxID=2719988 RepID=A0A968GEE6_9SPIO|nr:mechanosensitive ion channel family protein [Entomospira entomophilus]NIZ40939.1 mechanosensitive ion channel family protein [Entomospira entomophilus]WDI35152.1 mechanosensitive ion channel family protein [Entomospira entomophilus]
MQWKNIFINQTPQNDMSLWVHFLPQVLSILVFIIIYGVFLQFQRKHRQLLEESSMLSHQMKKLHSLFFILLVSIPSLSIASIWIQPQIILTGYILLLLFTGFRVSKFFEILYIINKNTENSPIILRYIYLGLLWPLRFLTIATAILLLRRNFELSTALFKTSTHFMHLMITLSWGYFLNQMIEALGLYLIQTKSAQQTNTLDKTAASAITLILRAILITIVIISMIQIFSEESLSAIIAGLGIGGAAIALASQDVLKNIFGGFTIMLDNPFKLGERVQVDTIDGVVEQIGFRSTRIRLLNGQLTTVPNQVMSNLSINNISQRPYLRRDVVLILSLDTPKEKIELCVSLLTTLFQEKYPNLTPADLPPLIYFEDIMENGFLIKIVYRQNTTIWDEFVRTTQQINLDILNLLEENHIQLAVPMRKITHMESH